MVSLNFTALPIPKFWGYWGGGYLGLIFVFSIQLTVNVQYKILPMTGFKPRSPGVGSDHFTN